MHSSNRLFGLFVICLVTISFTGKAQVSHFISDSSVIYKNEVGIDAQNILTFLKKNSQSYLLNYKRYVFNKDAIRWGLNLDITDSKVSTNTLGTRLGFEFGKQMDGWRLFYGSDISMYYTKSNYQPNVNYRYGLEPFLGAKYYVGKHFSVSSEIKLNYFYYIYRNKDSFDPSANSEEQQITLGSVGMIMLNFHF